MKNHSLYLKFNLLIVGSIFFCGLFVECLFLYMTSTTLEENLDQRGRETAESISTVISSDILLDDRFAITEQLMYTREQNKQIRYIIVAAPSGKIISSTFSQGFPEGLPLTREPKEGERVDKMIFASDEGRIREILYPLDNGIVGSIRIGLTENYMMEILKQKALRISAVILLICMMASFLATYYARQFLLPLKALSEAANKIRRGTYDIDAIDVKSKDEIGRFTRVFNDMARRLRSKDQENSCLMEALKNKEKKHRWLIAQLFAVREDERRRISRELHDETNQSMVSILTYLRILYEKLHTDDQKEILSETRSLTVHTLESLRGIAVDLHPPMLEDLGLVAAIKKYVDTLRRSRENLTIVLRHEGDFSKLPTTLALVCYRTMQEALTNIVRHAKASKALIIVSCTPSSVSLVISDNGVGFDAEQAYQAMTDRHLGIVGMRERIEMLKGYFNIYSIPGRGTRISIMLPIRNDEFETKRAATDEARKTK